MCIIVRHLIAEYIDIPSSCKDLLPNTTSGWYGLGNAEGHVSQQYCDMEREGCGTCGGWMRVAHVDMTQPDQQCPQSGQTLWIGSTVHLLYCYAGHPQRMHSAGYGSHCVCVCVSICLSACLFSL